ncbi:MAG: TIGR03564 family F420-dependent LLM class oxidoreductase, partial [Gammaproteobacteria bacterium]
MNTFRIGAVIPFNGGLSRVAERAQDFARYRFAHYWLAQAFSVDALTALTAIGQHLPGVELGTSVVPIYGRHPMTLAMQALTAQAALGGRLTLGVGLSHRWVIEEMLGLSFARPARHMREYLQALVPMLNGEQVDYTGETVATHLLRGPLDVPDAAPVPVLVAALGPRMLEIAGRMTQGTLTWMTGPRTIAAHIVPAISAAARAAGRRPPRIAAGIQFCVSGDDAAARAYAGPPQE